MLKKTDNAFLTTLKRFVLASVFGFLFFSTIDDFLAIKKSLEDSSKQISFFLFLCFIPPICAVLVLTISGSRPSESRLFGYLKFISDEINGTLSAVFGFLGGSLLILAFLNFWLSNIVALLLVLVFVLIPISLPSLFLNLIEQQNEVLAIAIKNNNRLKLSINAINALVIYLMVVIYACVVLYAYFYFGK